jgi:hypothetical protein
MAMVRFSDLKAAFLAKNPNATIKQIAGAVEVKYTDHGTIYRYRGTLSQIAAKLRLNCNEITLRDHGTRLDAHKGRKIIVNIFGSDTECLICGGEIHFWLSDYLIGPHMLKIYRDLQSYYFNLGGHKFRFAI